MAISLKVDKLDKPKPHKKVNIDTGETVAILPLTTKEANVCNTAFRKEGRPYRVYPVKK